MKLLNNLDYKGKKVLIIGLARTGVAAATFLKSMGAKITITDKKNLSELVESMGKLSLETNIKVGEKMSLGLLSNKDMVVVSPGVPIDSPFLKKALRKKIPVISEIELAYSVFKDPIIAVTGTNGKSTVSTLIHRILSQSGKRVTIGGNIGIPLSKSISETGEKDFLVAEISSFQLEWINKFKPYISIVLNITPDHLDRHNNMEDYINLKKRVFSNQTREDFLILNKDDHIVSSFAEASKAKVMFFSRLQEVDEGVFVKNNRIISRFQGVEKEVCKVDDIHIKGFHNIENALASILTAIICDIKSPGIVAAVKDFTGLEHRMEPVRELHGVKFINDSKATNVGAVVKSIQGIEGPIILIAGGMDKKNDFTPLKELVEARVKMVILIGDAKEKIKEGIGSANNIVEEKTLEKAVKVAYLKAMRGDTVLLSPACASFDMFNNYEERGRSFKNAVKRLKKRPFEVE